MIAGCSPFGGDKEVRKSLASGLTPKALYEIAQDKTNAGSLDQAIKQYEIILVTYPGSKYAIQARLDIAYNLFKRQKYERAIIELNSFILKYPSIPSTPYAYYLKGVIAEEKSSSLLDNLIADNAQRDVVSIQNAYKYYLELITKFPDSKYSKEAEKRLVKLVNTLARHELYVALYYTNNKSNIAAINRAKYIIENFPSSQSVPDALNLMAFNYDLINATKLASDTKKILSSNFPNYTPSFTID
jgi:outer membrane protein assembly factor BamD